MDTLIPNEKNDWLNQRDGIFDTMLPITAEPKSFFKINGPAVSSGRDNWVYSYSKHKVEEQVAKLIDNFNNLPISGGEMKISEIDISWTANLKKYHEKGEKLKKMGYVSQSLYRPYCKQWIYIDDKLLERPGITYKYLLKDVNNIHMIVSKGGTKDMTALITKTASDYHCAGDTHVFPLYWYEENKNRQKSLFDEESGEKYIRRDGITDWILKEIRSRYGTREITKEMIFYYVYGLLHSEDYRTRFAADLKKSLPRIPIVENLNDFMDFYQYGKKLADLHLNYEDVPAYPGCDVYISDYVATDNYTAYDHFRVDKMRFAKRDICVDLAAGAKSARTTRDDRSVIIYNGNVRIENIPEKAYEYIVNGKSAIEWIMERYCVSQDKKSLIKNDANDWAKEHGKPRYILDLLLSVINVSVQTVDIVKALPKLKFD